uniref:Uncharacterized protein n=1 Tax=Arcella intermedia TaxID=1963864 RepID=A0A6B2LGZ3_9EUKA
MIVYYVFVGVTRYYIRGLAGFFDVFWLCQMSCLLAGVGALLHQPKVITFTFGLISAPHGLWVLDLFLYFIIGRFPLGMSSYLIWDTTHRLELLTTTHHIWFVPLCFTILYKNGRPTLSMIPYHMLGGFFLLIISGSLLPLSYDGHYLNVNIAHRCWPDIPAWLPSFNPPEWPWMAHVLYVAIAGGLLNAFLYLFIWGAYQIYEPIQKPSKKQE